jgi:hypothetical protein
VDSASISRSASVKARFVRASRSKATIVEWPLATMTPSGRTKRCARTTLVAVRDAYTALEQRHTLGKIALRP